MDTDFINATLPMIQYMYANLPDNAKIICNRHDAFITYDKLIIKFKSN